MRMLTGRWVGRMRRFLFIKRPSKWNAWVRDWTAKLG